VCGDELGAAAVAPDLLDDVGTTLWIAPAHDHAGALARERDDDRAPDAARGAGHERGLRVKATAHPLRAT
jgi:hypothetical protein